MKHTEHLPVEIGYEFIPAGDGTRPVSIDIFQHTLIVGKSRTGKSSAMFHAIKGVIDAGFGCLVQDPHGPLADAVLGSLTPEQLARVVYVDPTSHKVPGIGYFGSGDMELELQHFESNMEVKSGKGWGPRTAEIFRAVARAVVGFFKRPTILHIYKMLARERFARAVFSQSKDPFVTDFYQNWYDNKVTKPKDRAEAFSHPRNKIDELMQPGIREIVCQPNTLEWAKYMDEGRIVIVNVKKGKLGARKAKDIGNLALMNMMLGAFDRKHPERMFVAFVDEYHNFIEGTDVETAFAEAGKCGLRYCVATQTLAQLKIGDRDNAKILLGNCSTISTFRVSGVDAKVLADEFADENSMRKLVELANYRLYSWTLIKHGNTLSPVLKGPVCTYPIPKVPPSKFEKALAWAQENTGTDKVAVEAAIMEELKKEIPMPLTPEEKTRRKKAKARKK